MPLPSSTGDSDARLRELADAIPQIVWTAAPDGSLTYVNARGAEYAGRPSGELHGLAWVEAIHPDDLPAASAAKDEAVRTAAPHEFEFRLRRADDGSVVAWFGTCTDIDELKQTQQALRDAEARLAEAQKLARLASWCWEPITDRVWWSDAEFELFGVDHTVAPSFEAFLALLHPDYRATAIARVEAMRAGADEFADDLRLIPADGSTVWIHSRARATRRAGW